MGNWIPLSPSYTGDIGAEGLLDAYFKLFRIEAMLVTDKIAVAVIPIQWGLLCLNSCLVIDVCIIHTLIFHTFHSLCFFSSYLDCLCISLHPLWFLSECWFPSSFSILSLFFFFSPGPNYETASNKYNFLTKNILLPVNNRLNFSLYSWGVLIQLECFAVG